MAVKGDTVTCTCGAKLRLDNDRLPMHKRPDVSKICAKSGVTGLDFVPENDLRISFVNVGGMKLKLACPACKSDKHVGNAPKDSSYPLACRACGEFGTLEEFLSEALSGLQGGRKHRYAG
jgi:hypothetical protein